MGPSLRTASASGHSGPIRQVGPGPMEVAPAEAQSERMAGRGVKSTSYSRKGEGHRGNHLQGWRPDKPQPESRYKPKTPGVNGEAGFAHKLHYG